MFKEQKNEIKKKRKAETDHIQRERDIIYTLSVLIRAASRRECFVHLLPAWEWYHDMICTGTEEEKQEILEGLKDMPTISRNYLFKPDFNYRGWLRKFLNGVQNESETETSSERLQCG